MAIGLTAHTTNLVVEAATRSTSPAVRCSALDALCAAAANDDAPLQFDSQVLRALLSTGLSDSDNAVRRSSACLVVQLLQAMKLDDQSSENIMASAVGQPGEGGLQIAAKFIVFFEKLAALDDAGAHSSIFGFGLVRQ